jgi:uncharacterized membrane protein
MADLVAIEYDDMYKAHEVRLTLAKLQRASLIDVDDAVVAVKDVNGKVTLQQAHDLTATGAARSDFWTTLVRVLFSARFFGLGISTGATPAAVSGVLRDVGIDDLFIKQLSAAFKPGTSALFVLVRKVTLDRVLEAIKPYGGKVLHTSLSHESEARLRAALDAGWGAEERHRG